MTPPELPNLECDIRLFGSIDDVVLRSFLDQLERAVGSEKPIVLELTTIGGDADVARRIALEMRLVRERKGRETRFVGKTVVYSAGVTIMSGFRPADRYVTHDARLLIHERRLDKNIHFSGPLLACIQRARELIGELENSLAIEKEGFADLIAGTKITNEQVVDRAKHNWYLTANEALDLGLIAGIL
ncbi:MAG: peptidase [Rhodospirillales bacterium]|jgi:ATP-dependent protease ClpP protease subunit|nr:peptidase [Rhodospirillales bacterium]